MKINKEMKELLDFLSKRNDYAIFAGFAAFLHTGINSSADVDIFVPSIKSVKEITNLLKKQDWNQTKQETDNKYYYFTSLNKKGTSIDIVYSITSKKTFYSTKEKIRFNKYKLNVLSKEAMLITKINQLTYLFRKKEKQERDKKVISVLRTKIDIKKLRKILKNLHEVFWKYGRM